ncbi:putative membrane protein [Kineococcus radiotolerans]|uniref:Putative membrane protein n=1 Tax=Kineococcus radiotolerans TaxID=131568 RepID=A0A7W4TP03_KINRA|nr:DUF202 domain-containing protein [Kineococcus radiotolerans]MBB2902052.1 putative membrane protein [Kineococcus radiotolerans]
MSGRGDGPARGRGDAPRLYDPGLQPERTALAWRRTALSLVVVSLGAARLLPAQLGAGAVVLGVVGAGGGVVVHVLAGRRARRATAGLLTRGDLAGEGAGLLAVTAATALLLGLGALALLALGHPLGRD